MRKKCVVFEEEKKSKIWEKEPEIHKKNATQLPQNMQKWKMAPNPQDLQGIMKKMSISKHSEFKKKCRKPQMCWKNQKKCKNMHLGKFEEKKCVKNAKHIPPCKKFGIWRWHMQSPIKAAFAFGVFLCAHRLDGREAESGLPAEERETNGSPPPKTFCQIQKL